MKEAAELYLDWRSGDNEALVVGLFGDDLDRAFSDTRTVFIEAADNDGRCLSVPLLVSAAILEWYNSELLESMFGSDRDVFCYTHPPVRDHGSRARHDSILDSIIKSGAVVVTESYRSDRSSPLAGFLDRCQTSSTVDVRSFGTAEPCRVDFFVGRVEISGRILRQAPSFYGVYTDAVATGRAQEMSSDGPQMVASMEQEDIEHVWRIYQGPFTELGRTDPTRAGFDYSSLAATLIDPSTAKFVYRLDGTIVALLLFVQNLGDCPWFSSEYFKRNYADYWESGNVLVFPGVISDERRRGQHYSIELIELAAQIAWLRGSDVLFAFECTQVSTKYVPQIAKAALSSGGRVTVTGLDQPAGVIDYHYLRQRLGPPG